MKRLLAAFLLAAPLASPQTVAPAGAAVQMEPVRVKAGPLGFMGIRCAVDVGSFAIASGNARIKDLVIIDVFKDSAAQRAGLMPQDHILSIDGTPVADCTVDMIRGISARGKGDAVELVVLGAGAKAPRRVHIVLGARKAPPG